MNGKEEMVHCFSHEIRSREEPKLMELIQDLGMEGYGIYWSIIEQMHKTPVPCLSEKIIGLFSSQINADKEKLFAVLNNYKLFELKDGIYIPATIIKRFSFRRAKRQENDLFKKPPISDKIKFGSDGKVKMTQEEFDKLISGYGVETITDMIERLNDYIGQKGDKYVSHYHTIKVWIRKENGSRTNEWV